MDDITTTYQQRTGLVRAYARTRKASPDGLSRRLEWIVIDPDQGYRVISAGQTKEAAWENAFRDVVDWAEDKEFYWNDCSMCKEQFLGYERRVVCKRCSNQRQAITPPEDSGIAESM